MSEPTADRRSPTRPSSPERRASPRTRALLAGILIHGPAALTLDCTIRDLSKIGARVRLAGVDALAPPLMLLVCRSGEAFEAEPAWRRGHEVGLSFLRQCDLTTAETGLEKIARRLWIDRSAR